MKVNEHQAVLTDRILMVPYSEHHVPSYHEWMQDEELQKATASEPLTLPEEYAMQKSWRNDADKLTFIVCTSPLLYEGDNSEEGLRIEPGKQDAPEAMIGDINLFIYADEAEVDEDAESPPTDTAAKSPITKPQLQSLVGEIEIMIARKSLQGKGLGKAILMTFMWYIMSFLDSITREYHTRHSAGKQGSQFKYLRVKIDGQNTRSIKLFESVGFVKVDEKSNYFGELELRWPASTASVKDIEGRLGSMPLIVDYPQ